MSDWFVTKDKVRKNDVNENADEDVEGIQWIFLFYRKFESNN